MSVYDIDINALDGGPDAAVRAQGQGRPVRQRRIQVRPDPQYTALEALHEKLGDRGFSVVGFPCNQFGGQEPGTPTRSPSSARPTTTSRSR